MSRHGVFNRAPRTPRIMATDHPVVHCMECMYALLYKQKNRQWVLLHPDVDYCSNSGKYYEIPSYPLEEVTE